MADAEGESVMKGSGIPAGNGGGFTLIEVIISLAILSITLITIITAFNKTAVTAANDGVITTAVMMAQEQSVAAGLRGFPAPGATVWTEDKRYPRYTYRRSVTETPYANARLVAVDVSHDGKQVFKLEKYIIK